MHMGMMPLIVERGIPAQVGAVYFHVLAEHRPFGTQQRHPLFGAVITETRRILPAQGNNVRPDRSFVIRHLILHLCQHYRLACIRK